VGIEEGNGTQIVLIVYPQDTESIHIYTYVCINEDSLVYKNLALSFFWLTKSLM